MPIEIFMEIIRTMLSSERKEYQTKFNNEYFCEIKISLNKKYKEEITENVNIYGHNFYKKLKKLIERIYIIHQKMIEIYGNKLLLNEKLKIFFKLFFKKASSSYLRLEHCQEIIEEFLLN